MNIPPLANTPSTDRYVVIQQRQHTVDVLLQKIEVRFDCIDEIIDVYFKMLHERLTRKEELLHDYEKDLGKLRQAEVLLREKDVLLQDLEVIQFDRSISRNSSFHFRRINDPKMMKPYFFEIL